MLSCKSFSLPTINTTDCIFPQTHLFNVSYRTLQTKQTLH